MSLIEILAALAVFVIGILSVVRIFPGGFFAVRSSEELTLANRLGQAELERWKANAANLPAGIFAWDAANNVIDTTLDPDNLDNGDVNKFRQVYEEAVKIPTPIPYTTPGGTTGYRSVYVLGFSPIEPSSIVVKGGPMQRIPLPGNIGDLILNNTNGYAIDYKTAKIYLLPVNYDRYFVISYSYWKDGTTPQLVTVIDQDVTIPANTDSQDIPMGTGATPPSLATVTGFLGIESGSESLHRKFIDIGTGTWSTATSPNLPDPYEYQVLNKDLGIIAFSPNAYSTDELTARGKEPLTAYIDYRVLDWHIIHEDRKIPDVAGSSTGLLNVKLTLRFLKDKSKTQEFDGTAYPGLSASLPYDVLAVDLSSGDVYSENSVVPGTPPTPVFQINYDDGIVKFDPSYAGHTFRIYYKADGDWAVQLYKAYQSFEETLYPNNSVTLANGKTISQLNYRQYTVDTTNNLICLPDCYAGTEVAVDYAYKPTSTDPEKIVRGEVYQVSLDDAYKHIWCADIEKRFQTATASGTDLKNAKITRVFNVYGVSVRARVIWRNTGKAFSAGRWRKVDLQSYLTRASN